MLVTSAVGLMLKLVRPLADTPIATPRSHRVTSRLPSQVRPPTPSEVPLLLERGAHLISHIQPSQNPGLIAALEERRATVVALDCLQVRLTYYKRAD